MECEDGLARAVWGARARCRCWRQYRRRPRASRSGYACRSSPRRAKTFCLNCLQPGSLVVSDGAPNFNYTAWNQLAVQLAIVTGGGKQACEIAELKATNTVLGNLKTAISGTYHAFSFYKYAERYWAEYQYRFNRRFDLKAMMHSLIRAAVACKPAPLPSLRMAEDQRSSGVHGMANVRGEGQLAACRKTSPRLKS
ncbi:transposase [Ideonella sp. YS5]|uniref:transposase n=1 Tax=Ideonella sp. YS5 TaxID=3453714 RepID=UPI003EE884FC